MDHGGQVGRKRDRSQLRRGLTQQVRRDRQIGDDGQTMIAFREALDHAKLQTVVIENEAGEVALESWRRFDRRERRVACRLGEQVALVAVPDGYRTMAEVFVGGA